MLLSCEGGPDHGRRAGVPPLQLDHPLGCGIHCGKCTKICNFRAFTKGEDGKVSFDESKCFGCTICSSNCPVCLGIWCSTKVKSETARLILLVWAVLGFVAPGYEHSIANAGIFTMAAAAAESVSMPGAVTLAGVVRNMLPVTLGNILGGALVGWIYWFAGREK